MPEPYLIESMRRVRLPPGILAVAALIWGYGHGVMGYALIVALLVEATSLIKVRFDLGDEDFHRLGDVTTLGLIVLGVVQFSERGVSGIYGMLKWFPLALMALVASQIYSTRNEVKLSALFLSVRFALNRGRIRYPGSIDMRIPLLFSCLLSATASSLRGPSLIALEAVVIGWLLLANRPRQQPRMAPVVALALSATIGVTMLVGAHVVRTALEPLIMDILRERIAHWRDPFRSYTALGELGRLKLSDRIVLRVKPPPGMAPPGLLREASYTQFSRNTWLSGDTRFEALEPNTDGTRWDLQQRVAPYRLVTISRWLARSRGMLPVPQGAFRIDDLPVEELKRNKLGALKVMNGPALVQYQVRYASNKPVDSPPGAHDLETPNYLRETLARTLDEIGAATSKRQLVTRIKRHFQHHFRYSLVLKPTAENLHPVADFLTHHRQGHCEYFATATVLLLRAAGVPARYVSGYSVQEWSPMEQTFIVRRRHAHTWAMAYVDGQWVDVDTTPATWAEAEVHSAPWWQSSYDALSYLWHLWASWRLGRIGESAAPTWLLWALIPMVGFIGYRVATSNRIRSRAPWRRRREKVVENHSPVGPSPFRDIERFLEEQGKTRPPGQPLGVWLGALRTRAQLPGSDDVLGHLLTLHYRHRFHPRGLAPQGLQDFAKGVAKWLVSARRTVSKSDNETPRS